MKFRFLPGLLQAALSASLLFPVVTAHADETKPARELNAQSFYQYLLAELAGGRGQAAFASVAMTDLAMQTRDAGVAMRATQMAIVARRYTEALQTARLWLELDPQSPQARHAFLSLLAVTGNTVELQAQLNRMLAQDPQQTAEQLMELNKQYVLVTDKALALQQTMQITEPYLQLPEAHFARAQAAYAAGQTQPALAALDQALKLRPNWEAAVLFKAALLQNQPAQALAVLGPFVNDNPKAIEARIAMARTLVAEKKYAEARQQFEQVLSVQPENMDALYAVGLLSLQLQETEKAEQIFRDLVERGHPESNAMKIYLGQFAEDRNDIDEAVRWYSQADGFAAQSHAIKLLARQGKVDEARALLNGLPAGTDNEKARRAMAEAMLLREQQHKEAALITLEAALSAQPNHPELIYETAMAAESQGQYARMETLLLQLMKQEPQNAHAYNALGYSLAERHERLDEAAQLIDRALELAPNDAAVLDSKGWVMYLRGDANAALDALQKAYAQRQDAEIAAHLGEVLWTLGRKPEAQKVWDEALRKNPDSKPLTDAIKKFAP